MKLKEIIKEASLGRGKNPAVNKTDNAVYSSMLKLWGALDKMDVNAGNEYGQIRAKYDQAMKKFYKKHNL